MGSLVVDQSFFTSERDVVKEELRQRIMEVAEELDYPGPNPAARTLRRGAKGGDDQVDLAGIALGKYLEFITVH